MPDPLEQLRRPVEPRSPEPEFADHLRLRIVEALGVDPAAARTIDLPERDPAMTTTDTTPTTQVVTPYLAVHDGAGALAWYAEALGAVETMRVTGDDGRLGHAEFTAAGARFMLSDAYPEIGVHEPRSLGGSAVMLHLEVADVDRIYEQAVAAGADGLRPPEDQAHGNRTATIVDPYGHRWMLAQHLEDLTIEEYAARESGGFTVSGAEPSSPTAEPTSAPVELGYLTIAVADTTRATRFYGELFGWQAEPGASGADYAHIANTRLPMGFTPPSAPAEPPVRTYFRVDDVDAYAARVEALGGRVLARSEHPSGPNAECEDDQGTRFDLWHPAPGYE